MQVKSYQRGTTVASVQLGSAPPPGGRGKNRGWTPQVARRHGQFLLSIDVRQLAGLVGVAFTLTQRHNAASAEDYQRRVQALVSQLKRDGCLGWAWLIEVQTRGVLHLHGMAFWPGGVDGASACRGIVTAWARIAGDLGVSRRGQHVTAVTAVDGWLDYQAKHAHKSVRHVQRDAGNWPWADTRAVWGKGGRLWASAAVPPEAFDLADAGDRFVLRRRARGLAKGRARRRLERAQLYHLAAYHGDASERAYRTAKHHLKDATRQLVAARQLLAYPRPGIHSPRAAQGLPERLHQVSAARGVTAYGSADLARGLERKAEGGGDEPEGATGGRGAGAEAAPVRAPAFGRSVGHRPGASGGPRAGARDRRGAVSDLSARAGPASCSRGGQQGHVGGGGDPADGKAGDGDHGNADEERGPRHGEVRGFHERVSATDIRPGSRSRPRAGPACGAARVPGGLGAGGAETSPAQAGNRTTGT